MRSYDPVFFELRDATRGQSKYLGKFVSGDFFHDTPIYLRFYTFGKSYRSLTVNFLC